MKRHLAPILLSLLIVALFVLHATRLIDLELVRRLEAIAYDTRLNLTMPRTVDPRIVIVDIDEKSLAAEGRWPWSRDRMSLLLDQLFDRYHASVAGFDVVFAEKDDSSGLKTLEQLGRGPLKAVPQFQSALARMRPELDHDRQFAAKLQGRPVVLGYYFTGNDHRISGALPPPVIAAGAFRDNRIAFIQATGYGGNLPELQKNAAGAGFFNPLPDFDGVTRRVPMLMEYQGAYYDSLALAMVRALAGDTAIETAFEAYSGNRGALESLHTSIADIPVDDNAAALVPYRGRQGSFRYLSATDVLHNRVDAKDLEGAIVLVGTTAPGLMDLRSTPAGAVYPGVEIHANLIAGMLDHNFKHQPGYMLGAELLQLVVLGLVLAFLLPRLNPLKTTLATLIALAIAIGINLTLWQQANLIMPIAATLLMILALFGGNMSYGFFVEARAKRQITGLFGQYVPPELVDEMSENPDSFTMEGESREMSVLFSDVRSFTTISEGLPPKELAQLMNEYLTPMTRTIHHRRGTIDKYIGDAIMAFWGAPLADPDHARHAVLAALEMQHNLLALNQRFREKGWPEIQIGVGINTGIMNVGNMGSSFRMAYTVMGDAVNLSSRLEGITKQYGVGIIVGENTREAVPEMAFRELDRVRVKGKDEPVAIYEPIGPADQIDPAAQQELERFQEVLQRYRVQDWDGAESLLLGLQQASPLRSLYRIYLERIAYFRDNPPGDDWDGVFVFQTK